MRPVLPRGKRQAGPPSSGASTRALTALLESPQFELIPLGNALDQAAYLPPGADVTVTSSPRLGQGATTRLSIKLSRLGFNIVPHVAARSVRDRAYLADMINDLHEGGIDSVFVIAGDRHESEGYFDSFELIRDLRDLDHPPASIGIAGYPEGHPSVGAGDLVSALADKQRDASYITTQLCFHADAITAWVAETRAAGVELPVRLGIAGAVRLERLLAISAKIGVGDSVSFLSKGKGLLGRILRPGGYSPDALLAQMLPSYTDPSLRVEGLHIFTFNDTKRTERWRHRFLERLRESIDPTR